MKKVFTCLGLACSLFVIFFVSFAWSVPLLDANETGFNGQTRDNNYDTILDAYFNNNNVVTTITNTNSVLLWVPWFKTSSSSQVTDLQSGSNCNSGQTIDFSHNCMVTDEFSQLGILISMGKDQTRMNQFYNTVIASKSTNGNLPGWRIYRDGNSIDACKDGINGNCDTASDGTARIIIALFTASKNPYFTDFVQKSNYAYLAKKLADDMLTFEVDNTCRPTSFGTVCYWLAGGSNVKTSGINSQDFTYTGYYPDAIIAMLAAYSNTNNITYYNVAKDFTLNYLQAANFNNQSFSVPPGKSFKWILDSNGVPKAQCTTSCSPVIWDGFDAPRALGICQANYYAKEMGLALPNLQKYCDLLTQKYMGDPNNIPLQYYPDGSATNFQTGVFAQGLEALHFSGVNSDSFKSSLDSALSHYSPSTNSFDSCQSIGVYTQSFAVRALGMGIGRDLNAFKLTTPVVVSNSSYSNSTTTNSTHSNSTSYNSTSSSPPASLPPTVQGIGNLLAHCDYTANISAAIKSDVTSGTCRTVLFSTSSGDIKIFACNKDNGYVEIYGQSAPSGLNYNACLSNGCVTNKNGFARFIPTVVVTTVINTTTGNYTNATISTNTTTTNTTNTNSTAANVTISINSTITNTTKINSTIVTNITNSTNVTNTTIITNTTVGTNSTIATNVSTANSTITTNNTTNIIQNYTGIASLSASCVGQSQSIIYSVKSDVTSGTCRTVIFSTSSGDIKIFACDKDNGYVEIYSQSAPAGINYNACLSNGCVTDNNGFARFIPKIIITTPVPTPAPVPTLAPTPIYNGISSLSVSCTYNSMQAKIKSDVTSASCRTVIFSTSNGDVQIQGCEKSGSVEVYRQSFPNNFLFKACMGTGCVDNYGGFASFPI